MNQTMPNNARLIIYLVGNDVAIINEEGSCVAASNNEMIGKKINLPKSAIKSEIKDGTILVLNSEESTHTDPDGSLFLKSLAQLTVQQYIEAQKNSQNQIDQFINKIVNCSVKSREMSWYELEAKSLGLNLETKRTAIVLHLEGFYSQIENEDPEKKEEIIQKFKKTIYDSVEGFFTQNHEIIVAYIGGNKFVIFKKVKNDYDEGNLKKFFKTAHESIFNPLRTYQKEPIYLGFGDSHEGLQGMILAYKEANLALETGRKLAPQEHSHYFGDLSELRIIAEEDNERKIEYASEIITRLEHKELKITLETFFDENLNLTNTAAKLKIHPNTVSYRLDKIQKVLGLDPRVFSEANAIKIALLTNKILAN